MNYIKWNDLIARKFFNENMAGREVLLYVNEDTINQIGAEAGAGVEDFIQSVKVGPDWATKSDICQKALQSYRGWRIKHLEYPPYIAYLALFVLAATRGGDYDPKAYYPRFWELLGELDSSGTPIHFDRMGELWKDLEKWSTEDKHEELGRFTARIRGGWVHVGRPLSQTLLSDDERNYLPLIFSEAELDPTDTPSDAVIRRVLLRYGKNGLEKRTLKLLKGTQGDSSEMVNALIDLVLNKLVEWDGRVDLHTTSGSDHTTSQVGLRIYLKLNRASGTIASTLRLKTNRPFPDNGLEFEYDGQIFSCRETVPNWSTKLTNTNTRPQRPLDAATVNWSTGARFEDKENKWRAHLKGADVRLFLLGNIEGLPGGWVESQRLERNCEFVVACRDSRVADVHRWGTDCCEKFEERSLQGLPHGWSIFEGRSAHESCEGVDVLTISSLLRIRLQGGIKIGRGNRYLKFGPPLIVMEGGDGSERVTLNGDELKREDVSTASWHIPADAPVDCPLTIEVFKEGPDPLQKHVIWLEEPELPVSFKDVPSRDSSGQIPPEAPAQYVKGAVVAGIDPAVLPELPPTLPTYLSRRITFLGSRPGEIVDWPDEDLPEEWQPVWAVDKSGTDKWPVHFCGQPEDAGTIPNPNHAISNPHAVKRWKEVIWVKRKKTEYQKTGYPALPKVRDIWKKYMEVAKRV